MDATSPAPSSGPADTAAAGAPAVREPRPLPEVARRLCDRCLGRRLVGAAGGEPQCAAAVQARAAVGWPEVAEAACPVCEGAFLHRDAWLACATAAAAAFDHATFQMGALFPTVCEAFEKEVSAAMGQEKVGETIRTEANRWLTAQYAAQTGKKPTQDAGRPDVKLTVDTRYWTCEADVAPVFVKGRYNKLRRDIPQTHWPCRRCQGRGCWQCNDTGVTYAESVEDAIGQPALPLFGGTGYSFHGAGREDIDALMLGTGRPFILEVQRPVRRTIDLVALEDLVNASTSVSGVAVRDLRLAHKDEVAAIKEGEYGKEYLAHCLADAPLARAQVEALAQQLSGAALEQRTPDRVSHRRADLVRKRTVHSVTVEAMDADPSPRFSLRVHAESGTYIKELVSGDEGRTVPSWTGLSGVPTKVEFLDVVRILDDVPSDAAHASGVNAAA